MPLHAVTEVYGEAGLRDRFGLETERFAAADRARLAAALDLAGTLHRDDRRVREPYLNHLLRVAIRIICYYSVTDVDVLVAALLHDAVEDHPAELAGLPAGTSGTAATEAALAEVARRFNPRVARLIAAVTNPEYDPDRDRDEQYRAHLAESLDREPWARVIKVSDFTDNGVGVIHTTGDKVQRSARKYRPLVPLFRDLVTRPDTPLGDDARTHILGQIDLAEQRFAAILDDPAEAPAAPSAE
ncbi:hypothetical protein Pen02_67790 [Plantactinospora endophytica]|uniref:Phosphohydrolase n=2 Tax=Plantactinospora endophytica TaxID=673535 RepID=A0ABQ4EAX6_9ACTN|nr:hypothetical protein Pen02_67790 [Plantactinospora endophytica]